MLVKVAYYASSFGFFGVVHVNPGSDRFKRRSVIHSDLKILLLAPKLKTSNNVTKCLRVEMNNDKNVASKIIR